MAGIVGLDQSPFRQMAQRARQMGARDIPGAVIQALNETAQEARDANRAAMPSVFDRPMTFTINSIIASRAKPQQGNDPMSKVLVLPRLVDILVRQEQGGVEDGLAFADPAARNKYGSLTPKQRYKLWHRKGYFRTTINGLDGIWKRIPNQHRVKLIVAYVDRGHYRPRFGFMDRSKATGERVLGPALQRELDRRLSAPPGGPTP